MEKSLQVLHCLQEALLGVEQQHMCASPSSPQLEVLLVEESCGYISNSGTEVARFIFVSEF